LKCESTGINEPENKQARPCGANLIFLDGTLGFRLIEKSPTNKKAQVADQPIQEPNCEKLELFKRANEKNNLELVTLVNHNENHQKKERLNPVQRNQRNEEENPPRNPLHLFPNRGINWVCRVKIPSLEADP
jgi:hypothetical protein